MRRIRQAASIATIAIIAALASPSPALASDLTTYATGLTFDRFAPGGHITFTVTCPVEGRVYGADIVVSQRRGGQVTLGYSDPGGPQACSPEGVTRTIGLAVFDGRFHFGAMKVESAVVLGVDEAGEMVVSQFAAGQKIINKGLR